MIKKDELRKNLAEKTVFGTNINDTSGREVFVIPLRNFIYEFVTKCYYLINLGEYNKVDCYIYDIESTTPFESILISNTDINEYKDDNIRFGSKDFKKSKFIFNIHKSEDEDKCNLDILSISYKEESEKYIKVTKKLSTKLDSIKNAYILVFINRMNNHIYFNIIDTGDIESAPELMKTIDSGISRVNLYGINSNVPFESIIDSTSKECRVSQITCKIEVTNDFNDIPSISFDDSVENVYTQSFYTRETVKYNEKGYLEKYNLQASENANISYISKEYKGEGLKYICRDDIVPDTLSCSITFMNGCIINITHFLSTEDIDHDGHGYYEYFCPLGTDDGDHTLGGGFIFNTGILSKNKYVSLKFSDLNKTDTGKIIYNAYFKNEKEDDRITEFEIDLDKLFFNEDIKNYFGIKNNSLIITINDKPELPSLFEFKIDSKIDDKNEVFVQQELSIGNFAKANNFSMNISIPDVFHPIYTYKRSNFSYLKNDNLIEECSGMFVGSPLSFIKRYYKDDTLEYKELGLDIIRKNLKNPEYNQRTDTNIESFYHNEDQDVYIRDIYGLPTIKIRR